MKILLKQTLGFLTFLSIALLMLTPINVHAADDEDSTESDCTGATLEEIFPSGEGKPNYVVTEINEPIGDVDQMIFDGEIPLSAVFWKYSCDNENYYMIYTAGCPAGQSCSIVQLIAGTSGTAILKTYIALIYRWAAGIVGIVAVLVIVISGIQISIDQGGGENVTAAKNRIMQSLAAIVILFLSALILYTINPTFFQR